MSYVEFSAKEIVKSCNIALANQQKRVDALRERRIAELMAKKSWLFGQHTRDSAITSMKSTPPESLGMSEWDEYEYYGMMDRNRLEKLKALAESAPKGKDSIMLSADDAYLLKEYRL